MKQRPTDPAREGLQEKLPPLETFANQFTNYVITIVIPEYTSLCPKTGQPDFGTITIQYQPRHLVIELKSLKVYIQSYRQLGIFYENAVNRILKDVVKACHPVWARVKGEFTPRGGIRSVIEARSGRVPTSRKW
ncbi:MAG: preQ(1) synthase [Candidatus Omnitrophica bacterium]|nr:preQ(1) synthase [Candidatus Omnitrophota bacterium]MCM8770171.1 preQ(1) synthase [Candidatus Omnitrophota bacterium]